MPVLRRTAVKTRSYAMPDTTMSLCGPSTWLTRAVHDDIVSRTTNSVLDDRLMAPIHVQDTSYSPTRHTKWIEDESNKTNSHHITSMSVQINACTRANDDSDTRRRDSEGHADGCVVNGDLDTPVVETVKPKRCCADLPCGLAREVHCSAHLCV
jgi:hypothetical protein